MADMPCDTRAMDERRLAQLGQAVQRALRARRPPLSARKAGHQAEISPNTLTRVFKGLPVQPVTYSKLEHLFGWPIGTCEDYLEGRGDLPRGEVDPAEPLDQWEAEIRRMRFVSTAEKEAMIATMRAIRDRSAEHRDTRHSATIDNSRDNNPNEGEDWRVAEG